MSDTRVTIIPFARREAQRETVLVAAHRIQRTLHAIGIEAEVDERFDVRLGERFAKCEAAGLTRIEIGPRDLEADRLVVRRGATQRKNSSEADIVRTVCDVAGIGNHL